MNHPIGQWDIMAGGWVHPNPALKELFPGIPRLGTLHVPWLQVTELTDVLNPLEETEIVFPDYAFYSSEAAYKFQNPRWEDE